METDPFFGGGGGGVTLISCLVPDGQWNENSTWWRCAVQAGNRTISTLPVTEVAPVGTLYFSDRGIGNGQYSVGCGGAAEFRGG